MPAGDLAIHPCVDPDEKGNGDGSKDTTHEPSAGVRIVHNGHHQSDDIHKYQQNYAAEGDYLFRGYPFPGVGSFVLIILFIHIFSHSAAYAVFGRCFDYHSIICGNLQVSSKNPGPAEFRKPGILKGEDISNKIYQCLLPFTGW